jgi:hypothetical protein
MRTIRVSTEVWDAIAARGKFGETPDDVLRRVFLLRQPRRRGQGRIRHRQATQRMAARVSDGHLVVAFKDGASRTFPLPRQGDRPTIRKVRASAVGFARENGGTLGQQHAVMKALTQAGYHIAR